MENHENNGVTVGLTGQTGAGKSTVCALLKGRGYKIIDADSVARKVVENGEQCLLDLAIEFSIVILNEDGTLNRKKLSEIVFDDKEKLIRLNEITHPYIIVEINSEIEALFEKGEKFIFIDAPTLFESGADSMCDKIVSVIAPKKNRLERIMARDRLSYEEAKARMRAQHSDSFYVERSDFVIENSSDTSALRVKVMEMLEKIGVVSREQ